MIFEKNNVIMKKVYLSPSMQVITLDAENMIAVSDPDTIYSGHDGGTQVLTQKKSSGIWGGDEKSKDGIWE